MKIIDFEKKGNLVRFYLGDDSLDDWWGDDWDDYPYECNAGVVYPHFVSAIKDVSFPFDHDVLEPCNGTHDSCYSKEDIRNRRVPCLIVVPPEEASWGAWNFQQHVGSDKVHKIYFGDQIEEVLKTI